MKWNREDIIWAAGLFEGEGCISKCNTKKYGEGRSRSWRLNLKMTDKDVVEKFASIMGFGQISFEPHENQQDLYHWYMGRRYQVYAVLAIMYPWFGERRKAKAREAMTGIMLPDPRIGMTQRRRTSS